MNQDWDIKIDLDGTEHKLRLLQSEGRKHWVVREIPPQPRVEEEASARLGEAPLNNLPFEMDNWSWGVGLDKFGLNRNDPGRIFRYFDGHGIDTSEPNIVRHGPGFGQTGTITGTPLQVLLFKNKVIFLTATKLYDWNGSTLTQRIDNAGSFDHLQMEVFGTNLYIAQDNGQYTRWDGSTATAISTGDDQSESSYFLSLQGATEPLMVKVVNGNQIDTSTDPSSATGWATTGQVKVGDGAPITSLTSVSGLLFVTTESGIFVVDSEDVVVELYRLLRTRRAAGAFSILASSGLETWYSDGKDVFRVIATGFEVFDIRNEGPFLNIDEKPVNVEGIRGDIKAIALDLDAVYISVQQGADHFIYKGVETSRGIFTWSPLINENSATVSTALGIIKLTGDAEPVLYTIDSAGAILSYVLKNWPTFRDDWRIRTPWFTATLETWDKLWDEVTAFIELAGDGAMRLFYRTNVASGTVEFNGGGNGSMPTDGVNNIKLATPIAGQRIQLEFVGTTAGGAGSSHLRSFNLEGRLIPDHRRTFDFRVVADTKTETDFIYSLRTDVDSYILITDRFGTQYKTFIIPGFPVEEELFDDLRQEPVRTYHLVAREVG